MASTNVISKFSQLFGRRSAVVIGMVHVDALPGTPKHNQTMSQIITKACKEASIYKQAAVDGIMIENMHDTPYLNQEIGPEVTAAMSAICCEVKRVAPDIPCGIQILAGANKEAMAVAKACSLDFVRVEGFVFSHVADEGLMNSCAGELLRYRKSISADNVLIFCDIKKKHSSHAITSDVNLAETAKAAEFFLADGVIVTGTSTGAPANHMDMLEVKKSVNIPVLIGSGVTLENVQTYIQASGMIIGSYFKESGHWCGDVEFNRVKSFMAKVERLRI